MNQGDTSGWYFGWNIVAVATVLTLLTVGMRLGIGPFFLPMANDLGFSRSLLAGIVAVGMLCYGLAMPLAGYLVAQRGTRFVLVLGTALVVVATVWTLNAREPVGFLLSFGVLLSVGLGFTSPVALTPVLSRWFTRRRGMALFFLSTGSMAGMAVLHHCSRFRSSASVAGDARRLCGGFVLVTLPAAWFVIRDDAPPHTDLLPDQIAAVTASSPADCGAPRPGCASTMPCAPRLSGRCAWVCSPAASA